MEWAYGVTTFGKRRKTLLPRTLLSLAAAGFPSPRLFVDGETSAWSEFSLVQTVRYPKLGALGNWYMALLELWIRNPLADRFALFQDDFVASKNVRQYLERVPMQEARYWNLYTFPSNQKIAPRKDYAGWYDSDQLGKGAVGLVFARATVPILLACDNLVTRPACVVNPLKGIDGCVQWGLKAHKIREQVHLPSLLQHTGAESTIGNPTHPTAPSFRGEDFDAMRLIK